MNIKKIALCCLFSLVSANLYALPTENEFKLESEFYAKTYGVSEQEALRRLALQKSSYIKIDRLKRHFASRLAGVYIEHTPTYRVVFYLTGDSPVNDFSLDIENLAPNVYSGELTLPVHIRTGAKFSKLELINSMYFYGSQLKEQFPNMQGIGIDEVNNKINIIVEESEGIQSRSLKPLSSTLNNLPLRVTYTNVSLKPAANIRASESLRLQDAQKSTSSCTSGFNVKDGKNNLFSTTAAHCDNYNITLTDRKSNTQVPLVYSKEYYDSSKDFQVMKKSNSSDKLLPEFFAMDNVAKKVTGRRTKNSTNTGDLACHFGHTTGFSCGNVSDTNFQPVGRNNSDICGPNNSLACSTNWIQVKGDSLDCWGGDSGGPVFLGSTALGLLSFATYDYKSPGPQNWTSAMKGQGWCGGKKNPSGYFVYMSTDELYDSGYSLIYAK